MNYLPSISLILLLTAFIVFGVMALCFTINTMIKSKFDMLGIVGVLTIISVLLFVVHVVYSFIFNPF